MRYEREQERREGVRRERVRRKRRRRRRIRLFVRIVFRMILLMALAVTALWIGKQLNGIDLISNVMNIFDPGKRVEEKPYMEEIYLTPNPYSRPGDKLGRVKNIFVHYTANPRTSALQNRSYFENLKDTEERSASAHFIIGYEGEIVQCIPLVEKAYAVVGRNDDSISIECCYVDEDGRFTEETYQSLVRLLAWLLGEYHLDEDDILRHYDCGGKLCPLYYVNHEDEWEQLRRDVADYIEENGV